MTHDHTAPEGADASNLRVHGVLFDGQSSRSRPATLSFHGAELVLRSGDEEWREPAQRVQVDEPLGQLRRVVKFAGGVRFETDDRAVIEQLERQLKRNRGLTLVHRLEARWSLVLVSLIVLVLSGWAFMQFGLPVVARGAASVTPRPMLAALDRQTMAFLDHRFLEPSELAPGTRERLQAKFTALTQEMGGAYAYSLAFRASDELGANAFALPNGTIVLTDDFVKLARNDREILGVLAHEVGHVTNRHGARSIYQSVGVLLFLSLLTGDVASASTVAGTFSVMLVQNGYSREMEREADQVAGEYLMRHHRTTRPLRDVLERLAEEHGEVPDLLSTHPGTPSRLQHLQSLEGTR